MTWAKFSVNPVYLISSSFLAAFNVCLLTSSLSTGTKFVCVCDCEIAFCQIFDNNQSWKESCGLLSPCIEQCCYRTSFWSSEMWVPPLRSPVASMSPTQTFVILGGWIPSSSFHIFLTLFLGSTYRAEKIEFLVKFKQGDGLLDKDPRKGISISFCAICWLLEMSCPTFFISVFFSIKSDGKMYYYGVASWAQRPQNSLQPKKRLIHGKNISFTLIIACVICLHTLK